MILLIILSGIPCAVSIYAIFPLFMKSKTLESIKNIVAVRFCAHSIILLTVNICPEVDIGSKTILIFS